MKKNHSKAVLSFFFFCVKILFTELGMAENTSIPVNVGVVLDLDSDLDGKIALSCIEMALSDFYATHGDYRTRLVLNTRDSMKDVVGAAAAGSLSHSFPLKPYLMFSVEKHKKSLINISYLIT
jgi:ionotropic glutamate receptor